jgi:hypothetical protein
VVALRASAGDGPGNEVVERLPVQPCPRRAKPIQPATRMFGTNGPSQGCWIRCRVFIASWTIARMGEQPNTSWKAFLKMRQCIACVEPHEGGEGGAVIARAFGCVQGRLYARSNPAGPNVIIRNVPLAGGSSSPSCPFSVFSVTARRWARRHDCAKTVAGTSYSGFN